MLEWFRGRGNAETGPRDGETPVLERLALEEASAQAEDAAVPRDREPVVDAKDLQRRMVLGRLSEKVLSVHLANRFQTSYPLVLNFETLSSEASRVLVEAAAAALQADPRTAARPESLRSRMVEAKAEPALLTALDDALTHPRALPPILAEAIERDVAPHVYAVSLIALGRSTATGRHYLAYVAARLGLGEEVVASLNRRYQR
ncbi:hypothetical protein ASG43_05430 [Aureimonas sp. Leaf454]|uniref:DUF533 domain-containing protein n=1 Tax=Aureimonas sp. Leaf454 TaxID=1736381 RepID=UPI0006F4E30B|nr:DUF533 domain-containing protein [Aureimonas sp. Leaf454]KQT50723.1 hypothetical protein ASG43_05430 [Aureimonas sp. Leaf454]